MPSRMQLGGERYLYTTNYQLQPSSLGPEVNNKEEEKNNRCWNFLKKKTQNVFENLIFLNFDFLNDLISLNFK